MKFSVCHASVKHHQFEGVGDLILPCEIALLSLSPSLT